MTKSACVTTFLCNFVAKFRLNKKFCHVDLSVLKILKLIFNTAVWTVVGLYLLFILTFSIPAVQEYMARRASGMLAKKLGTSVSIERLDFDIPSHVTLRNIDIRDQHGHPMLFVSRLSARVDLLPLADGRFSLSTAQLFGAYARLHRPTADSKPNYQFVLDSLASKDTTSHTPLNLRINSLIVRNTRISYDQDDAPKTPGVLNPHHLDVANISGHIILKALTDDSLNVTIKRLALNDVSGLHIDRLSMHFAGGRNGSSIEDFLLRMPGTHMELGDIRARYHFRGDHFVVPSLSFDGSIKPSTITLADLSCLLPSLKTFQSTLSVEANFNGNGKTLRVPHLTVGSTTGDIGIDIDGEVSDWRQATPQWAARIRDLSLSAKTVNFISENLKGQRIEVPEEIVRLGDIHLTGTASGRGTEEVQARQLLATDAGKVALNFAIDSQREFDGSIDTDAFSLKRILNNDHFGTLATKIKLSGQLPRNGGATVRANGTVDQFEYNGYNYQHIDINGQYSPAGINGRVSIDDRHIALDIDGAVTHVQQHHHVKVAANVHHLSPQATHLSDRWGDARFSAAMLADFTASSLNDAVGTLQVDRLTKQTAADHYELRQLLVQSGYQDNRHYITLESDFGKAGIAGDFDYHTLSQSITNFIADKLPTLPGLPAVNPHTRNNFTIHAAIDRTDWLQQLLNIPLQIDKSVTLDATVNDNARLLTLTCDAPQLSYKDSRYENGHVSITSPEGRLEYDASVTKLTGNGTHFELRVKGDAHDNLLSAALQWDNHAEARMSGLLSATASFGLAVDGQHQAKVSIEPSHALVHNTRWNIMPCHITYYDKHLEIDDFSISHDQQFLTLNGTASENSEDSIQVNMRDIEIDYVLDLVNFDAVDFNGLATGGGCVRGLFGTFEANGQLTVSDFQFQHGSMGTLHADVAWNKEKEQIDINATADDSPAMTYIQGYVSPARNYIDLGIRAEGTSLEFAHSFTESFISSIEGQGHGRLRLAGPLDAINLTGEMVLNGRARVSTLNCTYEMRNDSLVLVPNEISFRHCPVYDKDGNMGMMSGAIHHQDLTNLTFDIFVDTQNLLAYDFHAFGNSTFYGTVYASGHVGIHGHDDGVDIEADVTPQAGTTFVYNAASPNAISDQEFITWGKPDSTATAMRTSTTDDDAPDNYRSDLNIRLKINATPNATIRLLMDERTNDYITLRGNGELQSSFYNKGGFNMFGTYRVTEGTYGLTIQNIIRKNFIFKEGGTIVFGGDPYDAALNLQAQHTVNGVSLSDLNVGRSFANTVRVNCLMNITGQPRQPSIDFDLEMPNVNADEQQMVRSIINSEEEMNQQVVYLLAVGRFYPQGANNATTENSNGQSKTSLAMQSLLSGTLSGQINNLLGQVINNKNWDFGANISTGDEGWNNAEYEGLISGRLLNNRLLINGQFGYRDKATTTTPSFIGDFDIRYLLYPNGNLALKVYNQTNDRYFTKSSLNTQGIGIIMKKDFNGFGELFGSGRKRKQKKE